MQNTHGEANATLGENLLFFSSALTIHVFRQSTRLAAEATQGWWWRSSTSPRITGGDGGAAEAPPPRLCSSPRWTPPALARSEWAASRRRWSHWSKFSHTSSIPGPPDAGGKLHFLMRRTPQCSTTVPRHYRVNIFRKSATLPAWFWECWYCRCCRCTCCCCAWGTCCVCGCCWMYPTVLCCGTLACKNVDAVPPCTSPWFICGGEENEREGEYGIIPGVIRLWSLSWIG